MIENTMDELWERSVEVSKMEEVQLWKKIIKLQEELGELSAEYLLEVGYKSNKYKASVDDIKEHRNEEAIDCLITIFDILQNMGLTKEEIVAIANKKISVWETNCKNKNV